MAAAEGGEGLPGALNDSLTSIPAGEGSSEAPAPSATAGRGSSSGADATAEAPAGTGAGMGTVSDTKAGAGPTTPGGSSKVVQRPSSGGGGGGKPKEGDAAISDSRRGTTSGRRRGLNLAAKDYDESRPEWLNTLWEFVDEPTSSRVAYYYSVLMLVLIIISTLSFVLETVKSIRDGLGDDTFVAIEIICIVGFTLEIAMRLLSTPSHSAFFKDFFNWIDLLAVVPFYIEKALPEASGAGSFAVVRAVRLVRVARVVKVSRYSTSIRIFTQAMVSSVRPLSMLFFLVSIAMVMFSSGVYYAELTVDGCRARGGWRTGDGFADLCIDGEDGWAQVNAAGVFTNPSGAEVTCKCIDPNPFTSIPATFWWCLVTMTTVGYGDNVPVTDLGKLVAMFTMVSGIIILALPITVIGTNFARVLREIQHEKMIAELGAIDKNEDGVVDKSELKAMLKVLASLAEGKTRKLVPTDAAELIKEYDLDDNGVLDAYEMSKLKMDLANRLGRNHPAYTTLIDSAAALRRIAHQELGDAPHVRQDAHNVGSAPHAGDGTEVRQLASAFVAAPSISDDDTSGAGGLLGSGSGGDDDGSDDGSADGSGTKGDGSADGSDADARARRRSGGGGAGAGTDGSDEAAGRGKRPRKRSLVRPLPAHVKERLDKMEGRLDVKLGAIVELLVKMNRAVSAAQTEPLL